MSRFLLLYDNPPEGIWENEEDIRHATMLAVINSDPSIVRYAIVASDFVGERQEVFLLKLMRQITREYRMGL